jgi:hypothetical protein
VQSNALDAARLPRRRLLALSALTALAPRLHAGRGVPTGPPVRSALDLDRFLAEADPTARTLIGDTSREGQDRYLRSLAALAAGLGGVPIPEMNETTAPGAPGRTFLGVNECEAPFNLLHWRLEPGAVIGLHPHIYGNVLTVCLEGEVRIENYEMLDERDFDTREPFQVRRTNDQLLTPGDVNLVNLEHGYVHGFTAGPAGARGLDITTIIRAKRPTPALVVQPEPADAERALFEAHWRHA